VKAANTRLNNLMRGSIPAVIVAAVLLVALTAGVTAERSLAAGANKLPCSHWGAGQCNDTVGCAFCGNGRTVGGGYIGVCYDTTLNNATCCAGPGSGDMPGNSAPAICHGQQQCHIDPMQSHYGTFYDAACCPRDLPVSCHGKCFPKGVTCCQDTQCGADQQCCDDGNQGGRCCAAGGMCCGQNWNLYCCGKGTKCNINTPYNLTTRCMKTAL
jgi:hypothetical protein